MGIDPFHLGVIFLLNLEVGYLHPPVGLNLFITSFTFKKPILEVTIAALPPLFIMIAALMIVTYVPALTIYPEADRRGTVSEMARQIHVEYQKAGAVKELPLPDGKVMKVSDCAVMTDSSLKEDCNGLFIDVTECRSKAGGQAGSDCEKKAIAEYLERNKDDETDDEDWDSDEDEDADAEDGKGDEKPGAGGAARTPTKKAGGKPNE
jgi:hypothetical protein